MRTVTMRHPGVGEAVVPLSSVAHYRASGWDTVEPLTPKERALEALVSGGIDKSEASRVVAAAYPDDQTGDQTSSAPADSAGASSSDDQSSKRRQRSTSSKEGDA